MFMHMKLAKTIFTLNVFAIDILVKNASWSMNLVLLGQTHVKIRYSGYIRKGHGVRFVIRILSKRFALSLHIALFPVLRSCEWPTFSLWSHHWPQLTKQYKTDSSSRQQRSSLVILFPFTVTLQSHVLWPPRQYRDSCIRQSPQP